MKPCCTGSSQAVPLEPLDGTHRVPVGHRGQQRARLDRLGVQPHHAAAAVGGVAAPVAAGQPELVAEEVDEQQPRLDVARVLGAVDGHRDPHALALMRWPAGGAAQGAGGEFGDQVALEVLGAALVGGGVAVLGGDGPGFRERVVVGGAAAQVVLGLGGDEVLGADGGQAEARFFYGVAREGQAGPGGGDRPVADAAGHLLVRAAGAGPQRDPDLGQQLAAADDGLVGAAVEFADRDGALAVGRSDHRGRTGRGERRGQVLGRVGLAQRPADGTPQAHDGVGDHALGVVEDREVPARYIRVEQVRVTGQGADAQLVAVERDEGQLGQAVDVDQQLGLGQPQLHHRDQAVPARHDTGLRPAQQ